MAGDPGVDEKLVLVNQIQPVQRGCELAAAQQHAGRGRLLEFLHAREQVAGDGVAVGPREIRSGRETPVVWLQGHEPNSRGAHAVPPNRSGSAAAEGSRMPWGLGSCAR